MKPSSSLFALMFASLAASCGAPEPQRNANSESHSNLEASGDAAHGRAGAAQRERTAKAQERLDAAALAHADAIAEQAYADQ